MGGTSLTLNGSGNVGFKVIETEEELRSAHSAGLLWYKYKDGDYKPELDYSTDFLAHHWRTRQGDWDSYILVEDE